MAERYEDRNRYGRPRRDREYSDDRGYMDRAGDEIRSWFGDEEAERRRRLDEERDRGREREREGDWRRSGNEGRPASESRWRSMGDYDQARGYSGGAARGDRDSEERRRLSESGPDWRDRDHSWNDRSSRDWSERDRPTRDTTPRSESVWSADEGRTQFGRGISGSPYGGGRERDYGSRDAGEGSYRDYGASYQSRQYGDRDVTGRGRGYSGGDYGNRDSNRSDFGGGEYGRGDYGRPAAGARDYGAGGYGRGSSIPDYTGRGPKGYQRSDSRIYEDVCDRLSHADVDASNIEVAVKEGEVTLTGTVRNRADKRRAEDVVEEVSGVREVHNSVRVQREMSEIGHSETSTSNQPGSVLGVSPNPNPDPAMGGITPGGTKRSTS